MGLALIFPATHLTVSSGSVETFGVSRLPEERMQAIKMRAIKLYVIKCFIRQLKHEFTAFYISQYLFSIQITLQADLVRGSSFPTLTSHAQA